MQDAHRGNKEGAARAAGVLIAAVCFVFIFVLCPTLGLPSSGGLWRARSCPFVCTTLSPVDRPCSSSSVCILWEAAAALQAVRPSGAN